MVFVAQNPPAPPVLEVQLASTSTGAVRVARDGYVMVLAADWKGQAIVIHPSRPALDGHVAADAVVQIRSTRAATWVAVWSDHPFSTGPFTANTFWSTDSLRRAADGSSVDALVGIARRMAGDASIAYATAGAAPVRSLVATRARRGAGVPFPEFNSGYLSPMAFRVRQAKYQGAALFVACSASAAVCPQSVLFQLGNMNLRNH